MLLNRERAYQVIEKYKLQALVASVAENVVYVGDFERLLAHLTGGTAYAVLPKSDQGPATLLVPLIELSYLAAHPTWMPEIRTFGRFWWHDPPDAKLTPTEESFRQLRSKTADTHRLSATEALAEALETLGLGASRVGFDDVRVGYQVQAAGLDRIEIVDAVEILREIRAIKSEAEIERLRTACHINDQAARATIDASCEGADFSDMLDIYERSFLEQGGLPRFSSSNAGQESSGLFKPAWAGSRIDLDYSYELQKGDLIRYDFGGTYRHYWADTGRTVLIGEPTKKQRSYFNAILTGLEEIEEHLKPGVTASRLFEVGVGAIRKTGIPHFDRAHCGHSIGIDMYDWWYIRPDSTTVLEPGMVVNVEVPYYELGWGCVHLEDTFLITDTGSERITSLPRVLFVNP
jgi:Xaa-Pro dipeptidase